MQTVRATVALGGHVVIATFAIDGPTRCSNLEIMQHSPATLQDELGDEFELIETREETHHTPWASEQAFVYCLFRRNDATANP